MTRFNYSWQDCDNERQFAGFSPALASMSLLDFILLRTAFVEEALAPHRMANPQDATLGLEKSNVVLSRRQTLLLLCYRL